MTMDRNSLGHTLVRFYLAHGSVVPFLDALTVREVHLTSESLFLFSRFHLGFSFWGIEDS